MKNQVSKKKIFSRLGNSFSKKSIFRPIVFTETSFQKKLKLKNFKNCFMKQYGEEETATLELMPKNEDQELPENL